MITNDERVDPPMAGDETSTVLGFVEFLRHTLRIKTDGLDADQLVRTLAPSTMTLGGMLKHLAYVEDNWFSIVLLGRGPMPPFDDVDWAADMDWDWHSAVDDDSADLRALWSAAVERSREITTELLATPAGLDTLSARANQDGEHVNLRFVLLHMVEEYGRHAGHADLIRESIDGVVGE